jgi:hypothetical protein
MAWERVRNRKKETAIMTSSGASVDPPEALATAKVMPDQTK